MKNQSVSTHLMSIPLPATSVATSMSFAPAFRLARAYSLHIVREERKG